MRRLLLGLVIALVVFAAGLIFSSQLLTDYWWFQAVRYPGVFLTRLGWQIGVALISFMAAGLFFAINVKAALPALDLQKGNIPGLNQIKGNHLHWVILAASVLYGIAFASGAVPYWQEVAQFVSQQPFDTVDPVFQRDVAFYFFTLPMLRIILGWLSGLVLTTGVVTAFIYTVSAAWTGSSKKHLGVLASLMIIMLSVARWLAGYSLLYSQGGVIYGAGFVDINVRLWALRLTACVGLLLLGGLWLFIMRGRVKWLVFGAAVWIVTGVLLGGVIPVLVQNWVVSPNEFERERPYLENHINMTRQAYGIDDFVDTEYPYSDLMDAQTINSGQSTIENVRLWDPRPILPTYRQLQEMRPYYSFHDADVDRYMIDGQYRQVLLAVREMDVKGIQNRTWINQHLQYTHGYGMVVSPVNEVTRQRLPELWLSDIPPRSKVDLQLDEPRIYFGELSNQYVIVNTRIDEFDYPLGDGNAFTRYTGSDGVVLRSFLHRAAFALRFRESRFLLSGDITATSRVLYYRNIVERAQQLAPFLRYDNDPYPVVHDGRIFWIVDAYTTSSRYPYALPIGGWGNYVRNSVKVVVDAYNGTIDFYQVEPDALLETYAKMYPGLIKPSGEMPKGIREHLRYPEDLLLIQSRIYGTYHMTNIRAFYNREDAWELPREIYAGREQTVSPYYVVMRLPDSDHDEFVLMVPFNPVGRSNMVAWLAARSDGDHYGEVMVFKFPKDSVTLGPAQIEARIDQDPEISQLLTLWGQGGSQVIRGNLLVLPVGNSILYVEPLYLQSEQTSMPQLQRVIVADQSGLAMASDLGAALEELLGMSVNKAQVMVDDVVLGDDLAQEALAAFQRAEGALRNMNFEEFGRAWDKLSEILEALNRE